MWKTWTLGLAGVQPLCLFFAAGFISVNFSTLNWFVCSSTVLVFLSALSLLSPAERYPVSAHWLAYWFSSSKHTLSSYWLFPLFLTLSITLLCVNLSEALLKSMEYILYLPLWSTICKSLKCAEGIFRHHIPLVNCANSCFCSCTNSSLYCFLKWSCFKSMTQMGSQKAAFF